MALAPWWALVALMIAFTVPAHAWWNSEWTIRKKITIDTSATGAAIADSTGPVPVLIRLHEGIFRFDTVKPDGSDIRFLAEDDKTLLPYHIERIDPLLNEAFIWVKLPDLKASAKTTIWMYYGNAGNKATKVEDPKGTYDDATALVYHFGEHGQAAYDFSGNGNNAQNAGIASDGAIIGTGLRLDGKTAVALPASPSLTWAQGANFTWSAWVKMSTPVSNAPLYSRRERGRSFVIGYDMGIPYLEVSDGGNVWRTSPGPTVQANTWRHLAVVSAGGRLTVYLDGESYTSITASVPALEGSAVVGGEGSRGAPGFAGELDDLVISKTARGGAYLKALAIGQGPSSAKLVAVGDDEQEANWLSAFKGGYLGIIVMNLSNEDWVIIGILAIMFTISATVMYTKAMYLARIGKGNTQFLKEWSHVATDLSVLDEGDLNDAKSMGGRVDAAAHRAMRDSPLYHIYHLGVEEIRHRLSADKSSRVLSARSIEAIRSTLDGGLVRQSQKLNSNMVLLTIAISGGPFLGLLGTVIGVMITFAAVAQAGDVNVNAIAPGIAGALLATVAGLGVAIPSLFGYNYLLTQVKSATSDMHVFIDEFISKLAEFYSEGVNAE